MNSRTYRLQGVVFFSFLALFSLIVAGIVFYGYRSNLEIMLQTSDELLYQISETVIRQTSNHLDPARKTGTLLRKMIERGESFSKSPELIETLSLETLEIYPQFSGVYLGDENGNFVMSRRLEDGNYSTRIISRSSAPSGQIDIDRDQDWQIIATHSSSIITYDPRERPWYILAKSEGTTVWSREYRLFTDQVPGITCAHPVYGADGNFVGAVGIDFRLYELAEFLKSLKIGESGIAFIADSEGNILAYPEKSGENPDNIKAPRSPTRENFRSGPIKTAIDRFLNNRQFKFTYDHKGDRFIASFRPFPEKFGRDWILGIIVPEDDFIGPIARVHETTLLFSFWLLIIAGFLTSAIARELTDPIKRLTAEAGRIQNFDFDGIIDLKSPITEIQQMGETMDSMKKALGSFKKYVPSEIVQSLVHDRNEARLQAQAEEITLMFTDISDFSSITERVTPHELMQQLSEYFDCIAAIIHQHGGTIDKYIGDSVMAFWGAPARDSRQAEHACSASLDIENAIRKLNARWQKENKDPLKTRIGINTGISLIGNFGSSDRFNYTAVGDSVNLASRLEGLNKLYGSEIIVSESTIAGAGRSFIFRPLDLVAVKGRQKSVRIFQLLGKTSDTAAEEFIKIQKLSEKALSSYLNRQWREAYEQFQQILEILPEDSAAEMYLTRCRELHDRPPGPDWDGIFRVQHK
ncbi:MAG TPA: adenylate/guanylate cyclase domain-containing protein [Candidatus Rifleibacterium sp.]|nr:adenylate/guanylate cyclase domain-containing protein [Candidatus Rifleibacterium sp.]HPT44953.1 adenylate/guanylate cyclase domain-containing protein [Candidatus Rifleibacterium sp.]